MFVTLALLGLFVFVLDTRSRLGWLTHRLQLLEEAVRTRLRATPGDPIYDGDKPAFVPQSNYMEPVRPLVEDVAPRFPEDSVAPVSVKTVVDAGSAQPVLQDPVAAAIEQEPETLEQLEAREPDLVAARQALTDRVDDEETSPPKPVRSKGWGFSFEDLFGRRLPIWAGGITLAIAGVLLVKYAVDAGIMRLLTPGIRVVLGALFGIGLIAGAEWAYRGEARVRDPRVRQALSGAGIATLYATALITANVYHLVQPLTAILLLAGITATALGLSIRFGAPSALLGLAGGLAAPALVSGAAPNVPLLAGYLALTIGALAGVARRQRWLWLGVSALVGGMGWSLWIALASDALDVVAKLSLGGYVLLLAIAVPLLVADGPRAALIRAISAIVGAAQLALMVALGGFEIVNWGLFILLAMAGQWLAWRESGFAIVPTISLALSALLLVIWPNPLIGSFAIVGVLLAAIHALPLLARLWPQPTVLQRTVELCGLAVAILAIPFVKFYAPDRMHMLGLIGLAAAAVPATGMMLGWRQPMWRQDLRFAGLMAIIAILLVLSAQLLLPSWLWPIAVIAIALGTLGLAHASEDVRVESVAGGVAIAAVPFTLLTGIDDVLRLFTGLKSTIDAEALVRWSAVALGFVIFGQRAKQEPMRNAGFSVAALFTYGLAAQMLPAWALPLAMAAVASGLLEVGRWTGLPRVAQGASTLTVAVAALMFVTPLLSDEGLRMVGKIGLVFEPLSLVRWVGLLAMAIHFAVRAALPDIKIIASGAAGFLAYAAAAQIVPAVWLPLVAPVLLVALTAGCRGRPVPMASAGALSLIAGAWALIPAGLWMAQAAQSLLGIPMTVDLPELAMSVVIKQLLVPAMALAALVAMRPMGMDHSVSRLLAAVAGVMGAMVVHILYRHAFAGLFGADFAATGLAQRLLWAGLLLAGGWFAGRAAKPWSQTVARVATVAGGLHLLWYSLVLHNPLWSLQAVGGLPLLNLILPLFGLAAFTVLRVQTLFGLPDRVKQGLAMLLVIGFAWTTLRQGFHGTFLVLSGVVDAENILRSLLAIALAVGFLVWGVRSQQRDWRIASLVLMLAAAAKVFLFDASGLEGLMRIGSFVALGFSLIGIGWLYSRQLSRDAANAQ